MVSIEAFTSRASAIGVVGLGYVGVSLLIALQRHFKVYGYDVDQRRVRELQAGYDRTQSVTAGEMKGARGSIASDESVLGQCKFIIVAVPTPIAATLKPYLRPL